MVEIKIFQEALTEDVGNMILNIQRNEFDIPISLNEQPDLKDISNYYQIKNGNFWVATYNNNLIGTIALLDIGNKKGALRKMFVKSEYRGQTYKAGQQLLETLFDWAKTKKFNEILLGTTEKFLAAQRFYEKNGFVEIKKEDLPPEFPIMSVDVKFYSQII